MSHNGLHRREICIQLDTLTRLRSAADHALTDVDLARALDHLRSALHSEMTTSCTVGMLIHMGSCTYITIGIPNDQEHQVDEIRRQALDQAEALLGQPFPHESLHESVSTSTTLTGAPDNHPFLHIPLMYRSDPMGLLFGIGIQPDWAGHMLLQVAAELFSPVITSLERTLTFRNTDPLTGLYNRRHMGEALQQHLMLGQRLGTSTCLVLIDLDDFKRLNDTHGHPAGDDVLVAFAGHLQRSIRRSDVACRCGGDEFALILPGTDSQQAERFMDRLHQSRISTTSSSATLFQPGYSYGLAGVEPGTFMPIDALIRKADKALYTAKRST